MEQKHVEKIFLWLDDTSKLIEKEENLPYLDSLVEACGILFSGVSEDLEDELKRMLTKQKQKLSIEPFAKEDIRKGLQLAILKGMKGSTQQQHYITPDSVALFMGYLTEKFQKDKQKLRLFDPACGTANLLTAVLNQTSKQVEAYGSEVDPTLIQLAYMNANLQQHEIEFFHQDSLRNILLEPVDTVVCDLPVGYYPDDEQAKHFKLKANEGYAYAHHLFIEQSLQYTIAGGYLILLIPNFLFDSDQSDQLHAFLSEHAHIQAILQLPTSMFVSEQNGKSILVLQKKGIQTKPPKKVLMAQLPSFKDVQAMNKIMTQIENWFQHDRSI